MIQFLKQGSKLLPRFEAPAPSAYLELVLDAALRLSNNTYLFISSFLQRNFIFDSEIS